VTAVSGIVADTLSLEVVEAERPARNMERNTNGKGRVMTGTYTLSEPPGGGTRISFESAWLQVPRGEALMAPLVRAAVRRGNQRSLERLAEQLGTRSASDAGV
jgi:hypothetical protein